MTTQNLMALIDRYKLYPDIRQREPREVLHRQDARATSRMHMISADVIDPAQRHGRPRQRSHSASPIRAAHRIWRSRSPTTSPSLYLNENLTSRTQLGRQTADFFSEEASRQAEHIAVLDKALTAFKEKHRNDLPELEEINLQTMERTELELHEAERRSMRSIPSAFCSRPSWRRSIPLRQVFSDTGQRVMGPEDRLKALKSQLASYKARYRTGSSRCREHPARSRGPGEGGEADDDTGDRLRQLDEAKAQLARALEKDSPDHPDVARLQRTVDGLETGGRRRGGRRQAAARRRRIPTIRSTSR